MTSTYRIGDEVQIGLDIFEVIDTKGRRVMVQPTDGGMPHWVPLADCKPVEASR